MISLRSDRLSYTIKHSKQKILGMLTKSQILVKGIYAISGLVVLLFTIGALPRFLTVFGLYDSETLSSMLNSVRPDQLEQQGLFKTVLSGEDFKLGILAVLSRKAQVSASIAVAFATLVALQPHSGGRRWVRLALKTASVVVGVVLLDQAFHLLGKASIIGTLAFLVGAMLFILSDKLLFRYTKSTLIQYVIATAILLSMLLLNNQIYCSQPLFEIPILGHTTKQCIGEQSVDL